MRTGIALVASAILLYLCFQGSLRKLHSHEHLRGALRPSSFVPLSKYLGNKSFKSNGGKDIILIKDGSKKSRHRFLVQGGLHGNELLTSTFVMWLANRYKTGAGPLGELRNRESIAVDFLPRANPDGSNLRSRTNANGVNLNRNFGVLWGVSREFPGKAPFSEPESNAIRNLMQKDRYTAAVDVHGYANWIVSPSDLTEHAPKGLAKDYPKWTRALKTHLTLLGPAGKYKLKSAAKLGDGGAFEDWAFWRNKTLAFCLEMQHRNRVVMGVDHFLKYEAYITAMFKEAMQVRSAGPTTDSKLARQKP